MSHQHHSSIESLSSILTFTTEDYSQLFDGGYSLSELVRDAQLLIATHRAALDTVSDKYSLSKLLLGMMEHAIHAEGKCYVAVVLQIAAKEGADGLIRVANAWMHHLFYPMMILFKREEAEPSQSQTLTLDHSTTNLIESTARSCQKSLGEQVTLRERRRCAITGFLDASIADGLTDQARVEILAQGPVHLAAMAAAHVLPFCFHNFKDSAPNDLSDAARTWDMLKAWTGIELEELVRDKITTPENAILMTVAEHNLFQREADVQFATDTGIDPPDPTFICIHAAFAKVLDLCGAAEYIEKLESDADRQMASGVRTEKAFAALLKNKLDILAL
ncbi:hypothetical protein NLJ89_g11531 [Agrocybe chaxingu]|uniref:HNH nuclease domain-containing protein n=1 Tax=Agrocybe chaxingu TaxID=84603 RepID=A0A9W8MPX6_9AGAR|nr:hypothetical protein NLJ89_g11531 [Agrocybe chaxingu]